MSSTPLADDAERLLANLRAESERDDESKSTNQKGVLQYAITEMERIVLYLREYEYRGGSTQHTKDT